MSADPGVDETKPLTEVSPTVEPGPRRPHVVAAQGYETEDSCRGHLQPVVVLAVGPGRDLSCSLPGRVEVSKVCVNECRVVERLDPLALLTCGLGVGEMLGGRCCGLSRPPHPEKDDRDMSADVGKQPVVSFLLGLVTQLFQTSQSFRVVV